MEKIINNKTKLKENIMPPPSKSLTHRAIIASSLANGVSIIKNISFSDDTKSTISAVSQMGAKCNLIINKDKTYDLKVEGIMPKKNTDYYYCNAEGSATTLRIMIPIIMTMYNEMLFDADETLRKRPMTTYYDIFEKKNIKYSLTKGNLPLEINSNLQAGEYHIKSNISSQFISGMLFALPILKNDSKLIIEGKISSEGYINMTLFMLEKFGIKIEKKENSFLIKGNQKYKTSNIEIEDDYSLLANFLVAKKLGKNINIKNLEYEKSVQKDSLVVKILNDEEILNIYEKTSEKTRTLFIDEIPDLMPILAFYFSMKDNMKTEIRDFERLRFKESDRVKTVIENLSKLGQNISLSEDKIIINGKKSIQNGLTIDPKNDHRIAIMAGIAGLFSEKDIIIKNSECVNKSCPSFWNNFE